MAEQKKPKKWMQNLDIKEGSLTKSAAAAGKSISEFCKSGDLSATNSKRCNLAKTFKKASKKK